MSADSDQPRPSFRFRDQFSRLKDKVKEKVKDKAIKHNITAFVHHNLTSNDTQESDGSRHGFRQQLHQYKEALKNKTHYNSFKDKIKEKIDDKLNLNDNKTYPKGFYDALFSPETENDVYLKTALICLWALAVLCIIPTLIVIFLPGKKQETKPTPRAKAKSSSSGSSTNMIFFHVFLCELFYLIYVLLAMINVAQDFHLPATFCDVANYGKGDRRSVVGQDTHSCP